MLACVRPSLAFGSLGRKPVVAKDLLNFKGEIQSEPAKIDQLVT
jgi:hypothetical protein